MPHQTPPDEGMVISDRSARTIEAIDKTYSEMKPLEYTPSTDHWRNLKSTQNRLLKGKELTVVNLGDSIVNDTWRSGWSMLVQRKYPHAAINSFVVVRGSTGCWWYKDNGRVERYVLDKKPDLVLIGGISHHEDIDSIREVIKQIRMGSKAEILLMTGPFGYTNPNDAKWLPDIDPTGDTYRAKLKRVSEELHTGFLDMEGVWGSYVRSSGKEVTVFKRDVVHANEQGEQILGRILERFFDAYIKK